MSWKVKLGTLKFSKLAVQSLLCIQKRPHKHQALKNTSGNRCRSGRKTSKGKAVPGWRSQEKTRVVCKEMVLIRAARTTRREQVTAWSLMLWCCYRTEAKITQYILFFQRKVLWTFAVTEMEHREDRKTKQLRLISKSNLSISCSWPLQRVMCVSDR